MCLATFVNFLGVMFQVSDSISSVCVYDSHVFQAVTFSCGHVSFAFAYVCAYVSTSSYASSSTLVYMSAFVSVSL